MSRRPPSHDGFNCLWQVHDLDEQTWRTVEVVPIDIASKDEVAPGVSFYTNDRNFIQH